MIMDNAVSPQGWGISQSIQGQDAKQRQILECVGTGKDYWGLGQDTIRKLIPPSIQDLKNLTRERVKPSPLRPIRKP